MEIILQLDDKKFYRLDARSSSFRKYIYLQEITLWCNENGSYLIDYTENYQIVEETEITEALERDLKDLEITHDIDCWRENNK